MRVNEFKIIGNIVSIGFSALKDVLPLITKYKDKTSTNEIILGKWQHKKK